jgi:fucose permease
LVHLLLVIIYISFISLGLPDALLGAGWPAMHLQFSVPVSYMGPVALLISTGTVISSLFTDRLANRFGTGKVTAFSVALTAASLMGFALSGSYWMLLLLAVPYGLGAGCVDASLNNYVAIHYASRHMSWLHCMWGLGAATGPYIMGFVLTCGMNWNMGYWSVGILQAVLVLGLFVSLPLWKKALPAQEEAAAPETVGLLQIFKIPGAKAIILTFFCYCALEQTAGQWAGSYFNLHLGLSQEQSASLAGLFYLGLTLGRAVSGFLTLKLNDRQMTYLGMGILCGGLAIMLLPLGLVSAAAGLVIAGLGCSPIYPCVIHSTPAIFGAARSQSIIGVLMASAYVGICVMPPVFGFVADWIGIWSLPVVLLAVFIVMFLSYKQLRMPKTTEIS